MRTRIGSLCAVAMVGALAAGCPPATPPFDVTGTYVGTWSGMTDEETTKQTGEEQTVENCPLTITLTQNVNAAFPGNFAVQGTVEVDYSCIDLPEWAAEPENSTVNVSGVLTEDGQLGLLSGGCGTGLCVALGLGGDGQDTDGDGIMDVYSGDWSWRILLAGVAPFGLDGTFETTRQE